MSENRNRATNIRLDKMTTEEQENFRYEIMEARKKVAPTARLTIVEGDEVQLPSANVEQRQIEGDN